MNRPLLLLCLSALCSPLAAQSLALDVFDGDDFAQVDVALGANSLLGFDSAGQPARVTAGSGITISGNVITSSGGSGGSSTLAGLTDVTITSPAGLQFLRYNAGTSKWVNATLPFTGDPLGDGGIVADRLAVVATGTSLGSILAKSDDHTWSLVDAVGLTQDRDVYYSDGDGFMALTSQPDGKVGLTDSVAGILPRANGGTGVAFSDPNADRLVFWDDSAGAFAYLTAGSGLSISGTTLTATATGGTWGTITGTLASQADLTAALDLKANVTLLSAPTTQVWSLGFGFIADTSDMQSTHLLLGDDAGTVAVWFNVDGGGSAPGVGDRQLMVSLTGGGSGSAAAVATAAALDADAAFSASESAGVVTVTAVTSGVLPLGGSGDSAVSHSLDVTGAAAVYELAAISGPGLTNLNASNLTAGAVDPALLPLATTSAAGAVELATNGETTSGLAVQGNDARLVNAGKVEIGLAISDETTTLTTGTAKLTFRMPHAMTLTAARLGLTAGSSSGVVTVDINESGSSVLSTKLSCDASEKTSTTAATPAVISDSSLADDAEVTIDIDAAGTAAAGAKVWLIGTR